MALKVHEQNGNWMVIKDAPGIQIHGGVDIDYELYKKLKDTPHKAADHFHRDKKTGKLIAKAAKKQQD